MTVYVNQKPAWYRPLWQDERAPNSESQLLHPESLEAPWLEALPGAHKEIEEGEDQEMECWHEEEDH